MHGQMPQEIEVWYVIPALRREIAKSMIEDYKITQKQVAVCMNLTEAAVSQYLSSKRAKEIVFSSAVSDEDMKYATKIMDHQKQPLSEMIRLTKLTGVKQVMCSLHKKQDAKMPKKCEICFEKASRVV